MKATELERYADLIVGSCLSFRRGDDLVVRALPAHRELWVALADSAYRAGACTVELAVDEPRLAAARIEHGSDDAIGAVTPWQLARARGLAQETTAVVQVMGEFEARVLAVLPPERVAEDTKRRLARSPVSRRARREDRSRGTITSPEATGTEGTFRCSRPRQFGGRTIEGLAGAFHRGRLVRLEAKRAADRDWLARYLASIPNADRLGEIALVDSTSRIGRTGRVYYNALLDENAAAHVAFGIGFPKTRRNPTARSNQGVNQSKTHVDVMIGTDETEATGVTAKGRRVALIRDGLWQI